MRRLRSPFAPRHVRPLSTLGLFALLLAVAQPVIADPQDDDEQESSDREIRPIAQIRVRPEFRDQSDFNKSLPDRQRFFGQRTRIGVDGKVHPKVEGRVLIQDTRYWGVEEGSTVQTGDEQQATDLYEGYIDLRWIWDLPLDLRLGRQTMHYGRERLVGTQDFSNFGRTFDAFRFKYSLGAIGVDIWSAKLADTNPPPPAPSTGFSDQDRNFSGLYATRTGDRVEAVDIYWLRDIDKSAPPITPHPETKRHTVGARARGRLGAGFALEGEYSYQTGSAGANEALDIAAQALAAELSWEGKGSRKPKAAVGGDWATGDGDATDSDLETFNQLFPTAHSFLGTMDYVGRQNIQAVHGQAEARLWRQFSGEVAVHGFRLDEATDAWYDASGNVKLPADPTRTHRSLGTEVDLTLRLGGIENTQLEGGYSRFFRGRVIEDAIIDDTDSDWAYFSVRVDL
jgi:hypothetical protein